jgi:hypothetical protein
MNDAKPVEGKPGVYRSTSPSASIFMSKANSDTLDPVTNDDSLADTPSESLDPVPDRVPDLKPKRKRRPSMKRKATGDAK